MRNKDQIILESLYFKKVLNPVKILNETLQHESEFDGTENTNSPEIDVSVFFPENKSGKKFSIAGNLITYYYIRKGYPDTMTDPGSDDEIEFDYDEWSNIRLILQHPTEESQNVVITPEQIGDEKYNAIIKALKTKAEEINWKEIKDAGVSGAENKYRDNYSGPDSYGDDEPYYGQFESPYDR
jgi:hypothetical protein